MHQHETLSIGDNLGSIESLLQVIEELILVTLELGLSTLEVEELGGLGTLSLDGRQATAQDGLSDQSDGHAEIESVDGGPLSGTLLASSVEDLLEERSSIIIIEVHDVAGNLDKEGVKNTLVPGGEDITDLLVLHAETTLHDVVGLGDGGVNKRWSYGAIEGWSLLTSQINCMSPYSIPL